MVAIGYTIMGEQAGPKQLVADAVRAEEVGFDFLAASDHFFPWLEEQGHSPSRLGPLLMCGTGCSWMRSTSSARCSPVRR
jgi:alkanesulfonate monooxygenase SsuD/methylene tetrahydromethanopterin reductase-like flavin-dependent oxidoreductase (luciferase family)